MTLTDLTTEFLRSIDIHELLPQQEPFVMVGTLTHFDERQTTTQTIVSEENIFVDNGKFSAAGLMENVAQTCAARVGFYNKYILKKDVVLGFIGAVKNFEVFALPCVGEMVETTISVTEEVFNMTLVSAEVRCAGRLIATTEMKIATKE